MAPRFGISLRDAYVLDIWRDRDALDCVEVIAEHWLAAPDAADRQQRMLAHLPSPSLHCISLSLGSPTPPPREQLRDLGRLVERVQPSALTDHACITRVAAGDIGHLTPISPGPESAGYLIRNITLAQQTFRVPFAVENIAALVKLPGPWTPWQMLADVVDRTGAGLLLDLENLHADVENFGEDAAAALDALPLERVTHVHLAGGHKHGRRYVDSHSHAVPIPTLELLRELARRGARPEAVIVERDSHLPSWEELLQDVKQARAAWCAGAHEEAA